MDKKLLFLIIIFAINFVDLNANAISISNLSVDAPNQEITFDLEWKNSWRIDSMTAPYNWDAAWVFVKFSECDSLVTNFSPDWDHGKIDLTIANNNFGNLEPVLNNGNIGISDSLGVMLRRTTNGIFTNATATTITLKVANLDPTSSYHVRIVAIEMVYVTEGAFEIGGISNHYRFDSIKILNENAISITSLANVPNNSIDLSANYPKGYNGFHCMKYEISHGQYATFLNSLNTFQAANRYISTTNRRHQMTATGTNQFEKYISEREDRAYNYLSWDDLLSYLDWSALSPMTELQYEKACRGIAVTVQNEFAWGTTYINNGHQFNGSEFGGEYFIDPSANCVFSNTSFQFGDGSRGPARCGVFALPTNSTREQSGATYYGIMEMSGNLWESCVNVSSHTDVNTGTVAFSKSYGDGQLDNNGKWNTLNWPSASNGSGYRGAGFHESSTYVRLASRNYFDWSGNREYAAGGRGIR